MTDATALLPLVLVALASGHAEAALVRATVRTWVASGWRWAASKSGTLTAP